VSNRTADTRHMSNEIGWGPLVRVPGSLFGAFKHPAFHAVASVR